MPSEQIRINSKELEDHPDIQEAVAQYTKTLDAYERAKAKARALIGSQLTKAKLIENKTWNFDVDYEGLLITMWPTAKRSDKKAKLIKTVSFGRQ
jgi:hypothetical protein